MYAAPFGDNDMSSSSSSSSSMQPTPSSNSALQKKRNQNNKTIKQRSNNNNSSSTNEKESFDFNKVNSVLQQLQMDSGENDDASPLGDFPPMPQSSGVQKTIATEQMQTLSSNNNDTMLRTLGRAPQPSYDSVNGDKSLEMNDYSGNYGDAEEYYRRVLPNYNPATGGANAPATAANGAANRMYYNTGYENIGVGRMSGGSGNDVLMQKLNYMIHLLEEQQDERTNNVTEEVVLYSFLGIFIIFIVDSFARVGKYVR